ncbi:lipopolysaccharide biosynthesis protein [Candidatus Kaiserbacteria bacterium]|nr:lipopolysaccharide biosynthesis protein [Candidatus Kaiserbacteria bacterium]
MSIISRLPFISQVISNEGNTLSQRAFNAATWVGITRTSTRMLETVRILILARLLAPSDFGLFGVATLSMSMFSTFSETGVSSALVQKDGEIDDYLNTAWTVQVVRGIVLCGITLIFAPLIANFFSEPKATHLIQALAFIPLIKGFANIGTIYFTKELNFKKQFQFETIGTISVFVTTVVLAFIYRSPWVLVAGMLIGESLKASSSYLLHSFRPKISIDRDKLSELTHFGGWVWASTIVTFIALHGDDILVGRMVGVVALGYYQMAYRMANIASTEVTNLITQVTFPTYSIIQHDRKRLASAFTRTLRLVSFATIPLTFLIFLFASDYIRLALGEKWIAITIPIQILAVSGFIRSISALWGALYLSTKEPKHSFWKNLLRVALIFIPIIPLTDRFGITGASISIILGISGALIYDLIYTGLKWRNEIKVSQILLDIGLWLCICLLLSIGILSFKSYLSINFLSLILASFIFLGAYLGIGTTIEKRFRRLPITNILASGQKKGS